MVQYNQRVSFGKGMLPPKASLSLEAAVCDRVLLQEVVAPFNHSLKFEFLN